MVVRELDIQSSKASCRDNKKFVTFCVQIQRLYYWYQILLRGIQLTKRHKTDIRGVVINGCFKNPHQRTPKVVLKTTFEYIP